MKYLLCWELAGLFLVFPARSVSGSINCPTTGTATTTQYLNTTITLKILLVEFSDVSHRTSPSAYTRTSFESLLVSSGIYVSPNMYSPDGEGVYGSMRDYYQKMSNGNLTITGYVVNTIGQNDVPNWVTLPNSKSWYANNGIFSYAVDAATAQGLDVGGLGEFVKLVIIVASGP
jgi:hypothetical protein